MKVLVKLLLMGMLFGLIQKSIHAQGGESAVPFLILAPDSRSGGIGESGAGLADNGAAIYWNPAGIAFLTGSEVSITHSNWLPQFNLDLFYDYLTYRQYIESLSGSITASITYMNFGEFVKTLDSPTALGTFRSFDAALTLGYATKLSSDWGIGLNFRIIHSKLSDAPVGEEQGSGTATSVSFDIATMWRPEKFDIPFIGDIGKKFSMGINLSNLGPKIYYIDKAQADPIPTNLRVGFAYQVFSDQYNSLMYTLDLSKLLIDKDSTESKEFYQAIFTSWGKKPVFRSIDYSMGLEYWYGQPGDFLFALRSGFFYEDPAYGNRKFVTFGAGIRYDIYGFDFSYITTSIFSGGENHPLSDTLRFSVTIGWDGIPGQSRGLPRGI
ncbi:MAG TPA: PorV/PorQ family protein [Ignavibacteriaceae bacterium]|nr:PorV/PorQ family protein [Ignavibacteriaceae bacterium]